MSLHVLNVLAGKGASACGYLWPGILANDGEAHVGLPARRRRLEQRRCRMDLRAAVTVRILSRPPREINGSSA
jgi:hypothetical protein